MGRIKVEEIKRVIRKLKRHSKTVIPPCNIGYMACLEMLEEELGFKKKSQNAEEK